MGVQWLIYLVVWSLAQRISAGLSAFIALRSLGSRPQDLLVDLGVDHLLLGEGGQLLLLLRNQGLGCRGGGGCRASL